MTIFTLHRMGVVGLNPDGLKQARKSVFVKDHDDEVTLLHREVARETIFPQWLLGIWIPRTEIRHLTLPLPKAPFAGQTRQDHSRSAVLGLLENDNFPRVCVQPDDDSHGRTMNPTRKHSARLERRASVRLTDDEHLFIKDSPCEIARGRFFDGCGCCGLSSHGCSVMTFKQIIHVRSPSLSCLELFVFTLHPNRSFVNQMKNRSSQDDFSSTGWNGMM